MARSSVWIAAAVLFAILPFIFDSGFARNILSQMGVLIIFALAYNMLLGQGGMLSFGHAIFFGLAGYFTAHFITLMGDEVLPYFPISLIPLFGGLMGLLFGIVVGYVSTRRAGTTFAMISLGFGELVTASTLILIAFFNGEEGVQTDRWVGPEPFGITYGDDIQVYYLIAIWCLICMFAMYLLTKTPFGRMSNAVRDNPQRVQFIGYNTQRVRWLAFSLSAFFAGAAGSLHVMNYEHVGFETVSVAQSGLVLFMAYIGGVGHFIGPILGAILITFLNSTLSDLTEAWYLYLGLIFVIIVLFAPGGLAGIVMMHEPIWKMAPRLLLSLVVPYLIGFAATVVMLVGVLGLIELLYFHSTSFAEVTETTIFGIAIGEEDVLPWFGFAIVAAVGIFLCRFTYPGMARSWNAAINEIKQRTAA